MKQNSKEQKILGIIIARDQSKRIPRKNLKLLDGKSLMSYAIKAALRSKIITDVIISNGQAIQPPIHVDTIHPEPTLVKHPFVLTPTNH